MRTGQPDHQRGHPSCRKGQISIDYLVAIIILGVLSLALFQAFGENDKQAKSSIEKAYMRSVANRLVESINSAVVMGDGAQKYLTLPNTTIGGRFYNMTIKDNILLLRWPKSDYAERFSTADVNITSPEYPNLTNVTLLPGNILITNSNGTIQLENVR